MNSSTPSMDKATVVSIAIPNTHREDKMLDTHRVAVVHNRIEDSLPYHETVQDDKHDAQERQHGA